MPAPRAQLRPRSSSINAQQTHCFLSFCALQTFRGRTSLRSMEAVHKWLLELGKCLCIRFDWGSS